MIACLAGPSGTVVSHLTAAACFGLGKPPAVPQVTVPPGASGRFKGAEIRRGRLGPGETCIRWKLPCTSPTRTVIDCAGLLDDDALCELVDSALCRKLMQPSRLIRASSRASAAARRPRSRSGSTGSNGPSTSGVPALRPGARPRRGCNGSCWSGVSRRRSGRSRSGTSQERWWPGPTSASGSGASCSNTTATSTTVPASGSPTTSDRTASRNSITRLSRSTGSISARPAPASATGSTNWLPTIRPVGSGLTSRLSATLAENRGQRRSPFSPNPSSRTGDASSRANRPRLSPTPRLEANDANRSDRRVRGEVPQRPSGRSAGRRRQPPPLTPSMIPPLVIASTSRALSTAASSRRPRSSTTSRAVLPSFIACLDTSAVTS